MLVALLRTWNVEQEPCKNIISISSLIQFYYISIVPIHIKLSHDSEHMEPVHTELLSMQTSRERVPMLITVLLTLDLTSKQQAETLLNTYLHYMLTEVHVSVILQLYLKQTHC